MAFEVPLEADRVDDLNLFSTFVRAPVIGTLFWFLGGDKAKKEDEEERNLDQSIVDKSSVPENSVNNMKRSHSKQMSLKKGAPSLVGSEVSDLDCLQNSLDTMNIDNPKKYSEHGMQKKNLSWSDESGNNLVQYADESTVHEPRPAAEQPTRSAMSRSRSVRANANRMAPYNAEPEFKQYTGYLKQSNGNHIVDPFSSGTSGIDSPQWGWYINTTPPTPEMFYARPQKTRKSSSETIEGSSKGTTSTSSSSSDSSGNPAFHHHPNPVFRDLQNNKNQPMGWQPSVPI